MVALLSQRNYLYIELVFLMSVVTVNTFRFHSSPKFPSRDTLFGVSVSCCHMQYELMGARLYHARVATACTGSRHATCVAVFDCTSGLLDRSFAISIYLPSYGYC